MAKRLSGILLHITSLPSPYGIGDLGPGAYRFADFLHETKQGLWQILPLNPTEEGCGNSPYSVSSAFAGNINLISPELLIDDGLLSEKDVESKPAFPEDRCDYKNVIPYKEKLLARAYKNFMVNKKLKRECEEFCHKNASWLGDFVLFAAIKKRHKGKPWHMWDKKLKDRNRTELRTIQEELGEEIKKAEFLQYLFFKQWFSLRSYCNEKGIKFIGDLPIYVDYGSVDVWVHSDIFKLDKDKNLTHMAGVPPDYFSQTGQLWGNPLYRWDVLEQSGFKWWVERMERNFACFDIVRIDHFRGLVAYWEVARGEKTAIKGRWVKAPAKKFFDRMLAAFGRFSVIAEDLGIITPDVKDVLRHFKFPGMKVLLFAFDTSHPMHPYLPHTYDKNWVVYTGTHDNNTAKGWFEKEASEDAKRRVFRYFGRTISREEFNWELIRLAMMSVADTAIYPLQDILGLGENARMNIPSTPTGNWEWRLPQSELLDSLRQKLLDMTEVYGRRSDEVCDGEE